MTKTVCGNCGTVEVVAVEEKGMDPLPGKTPGQWHEPDGAGFIAKRKRGKNRRLRTLGAVDAVIPEGKSFEDVDHEKFMCGVDGKVYDDAEGKCAVCPGGCHNEKGLPTLLEVEGMAEEDFEMKVLESGYGPQDDLFVVHLERKDGRLVEAVYSGSTGEMQGWQLLDDSLLSGKSLEDDFNVITSEEAIDVALKQFEGGEASSVAADEFEGQDAWVVEMTDAKGDAIDVYVGLDGRALGYDVYDVGIKAAKKPVDDENPEEDASETPADETSAEDAAESAEAPAEDTGEVSAQAAGGDVETPAEDVDEDEETEKKKSLGSSVESADLYKDLAELESIALNL